MSISEMNGWAFAKYLNRLPRDAAAQHVLDCLRSSNRDDNMAWELMSAVHGEKWSFPIEALHGAIFDAVDALRKDKG